MRRSAVNRYSSIYYQSKTSSKTTLRGSSELCPQPIKGRDYDLPRAPSRLSGRRSNSLAQSRPDSEPSLELANVGAPTVLGFPT
eukprot:4252972-Prymnesium_polylepis.1